MKAGGIVHVRRRDGKCSYLAERYQWGRGGANFGGTSPDCDSFLEVSVIANRLRNWSSSRDPACGSVSFLICTFEKICDLAIVGVSRKVTVYSAGYPSLCSQLA